MAAVIDEQVKAPVCRVSRTPKAVALGWALRKARRAGGWSLREFAHLINRDMPTLSRWETGHRTPRSEQVAHFLGALGVCGGQFADTLALATDTSAPHWIATTEAERRHQDAVYLEFEQAADHLTFIAPQIIPDLFRLPDKELRQRQEILTRHQPATVGLFVGHTALQQASDDQLRHLAALSARPNIELRVVAAPPPAFDSRRTLLDSCDLRFAISGPPPFAMWSHRPGDIAIHDRDIRAIRDKALSPRVSVGAIANIVDRRQRSAVGVGQL
ncbi:Scr1 family TA system antitoxin-like transcriptional regulator [Actinokineospora auranticolor]|uniref:Helix-turn-helix protein n=1 Tax=Actinokineospora auranticolor TaxID=155976 RepID=A0A2S6GS44_9PSEU|nr:Scr1 family TA system antitoxin-like transcriptional regulator [Actinokineospora auranticolor]PPK68068.1 helix-turn-helix protein [Actinokineospora auranticolor]